MSPPGRPKGEFPLGGTARSAKGAPIIPRRIAAWLSGVWAGLLLGVGFIAAPTGFAAAPAEVAGRIASRLFAQEADFSLALAVLLLLLLRQVARDAARMRLGSVFSTDMLLVLGTLFCTVAGTFAVQPMMAAAKAGQAAVSFSALHGVSAGLFALKALLVLALAWRLSAP